MSKKKKRGNIKGLLYEIIKKKNLNEALMKFRQLIDAMKYMHNMNICHRNIKPESILFDENNKIKLIDFGFSFCYKNTLIKIFISIIFFTFAFDLP